MRLLIFIPLLVACSLPNIQPSKGGFWGKTTKPAVEQPVTAVHSGVIQTQTLAPLTQVSQPTAPQPTAPQSTGQQPTAAPTALTTPQTATPIPTSPEQTACRARGGQWGKAGTLAAMTCYIPAKDAGKSCSKQSDCSSQCLARSRSCAPIWPIFGCSEVLQNDGSLVKLCID